MAEVTTACCCCGKQSEHWFKTTEEADAAFPGKIIVFQGENIHICRSCLHPRPSEGNKIIVAHAPKRIARATKKHSRTETATPNKRPQGHAYIYKP